jgi:predicted MFS family arabinose efflux permease
VALGAGCGAVTFLLCYFFLYDARDAKRRSASPAISPNIVRTGMSIAEAVLDSALWRIGFASLLMFTFGVGLLIHQIAILNDAGVSVINAAWLASLAGGAGVIGKLVSGVLLDRCPGNLVGGLTLSAAFLAFALLLKAENTTFIVIAMLINGYVTGAKLQIATYLTVRFAGLRHMGVILGMLTSIVATATAIGPILAGAIYDFSGSYAPFLLAGAVAAIVAGVLIFTLPRYPRFD